MSIFDDRRCELGEGPLWHPGRKTLFWFDIMGKKMFARGPDGAQEWAFDSHFSAAGRVDDNSLILASETALWRFDIDSGEMTSLCELEAENTVTRSNDGRADPWGGFWIGTMGKGAEDHAGSIYRYYRGELRVLVPNITITNAICFAPDRACAYYTDTRAAKIMRLPLAAEDGWPSGDAEVLVDLSDAGLNPDGAVTDVNGNIWIAMWGAACVIVFDTDGNEVRRLEVPAAQPSCPAFGGPELRDLYVTCAAVGLTREERDNQPANGMTLCFKDVAQGIEEPQVVL